MKFIFMAALFISIGNPIATHAAEEIEEIIKEESGGFIQTDFLSSEKEAADLVKESDFKKVSTSSARCTILTHSSYSNGIGYACVRCGGTLVRVVWLTTWEDGLGWMTNYEGSVVSSCR